MRSVNLMGEPCKCPRKCADIKAGVYMRVKYIESEGNSRGRESLDAKCHKHLLFDDAIASGLQLNFKGFIVL